MHRTLRFIPALGAVLFALVGLAACGGIPGNAVVRDNKRPAKLSDIKSGQRAVVFHGPNRTAVIAHDVRKK